MHGSLEKQNVICNIYLGQFMTEQAFPPVFFPCVISIGTYTTLFVPACDVAEMGL